MKIQKFEDLEVWNISRQLVKEIYIAANGEKFSKDFSLKNQIIRAGISVMSNIAEGFERRTNKEFIQFLYIAKGSSGEIRSQLYIANDLGYLNKDEFEKLFTMSETISKSLSGFIKYLNK